MIYEQFALPCCNSFIFTVNIFLLTSLYLFNKNNIFTLNEGMLEYLDKTQ
jgi:hypothetical protein